MRQCGLQSALSAASLEEGRPGNRGERSSAGGSHPQRGGPGPRSGSEAGLGLRGNPGAASPAGRPPSAGAARRLPPATACPRHHGLSRPPAGQPPAPLPRKHRALGAPSGASRPRAAESRPPRRRRSSTSACGPWAAAAAAAPLSLSKMAPCAMTSLSRLLRPRAGAGPPGRLARPRGAAHRRQGRGRSDCACARRAAPAPCPLRRSPPPRALPQAWRRPAGRARGCCWPRAPRAASRPRRSRAPPGPRGLPT